MSEERKLNLKLLELTADYIESNPENYDQRKWLESSDTGCGTNACIAGTAVICSAMIADIEPEPIQKGIWAKVKSFRFFANLLQKGLDYAWGVESNIHMTARDLLGLAADESKMMFNAAPKNYWPEPFQSMWENAQTKKCYAKVAAAYLTHIIETGNVKK